MKAHGIEWTTKTWNPMTGCKKVSPGCDNCYAKTFARRFRNSVLTEKYRNGFKPTFHEGELGIPYKWTRKNRLVFVDSMSDLFNEAFTEEQIQSVLKVVRENPMHIFQLLTKRHERLLAMDSSIVWTDNAWMGVTVEDAERMVRIDALRKTGAKVKFVSMEPLLGPLPGLDLDGIDWVIVGGEACPNPRIMDPEWVEGIYLACKDQGVPFFFKQWGGRSKKGMGKYLFGKKHLAFPKGIELAEDDLNRFVDQSTASPSE